MLLGIFGAGVPPNPNSFQTKIGKKILTYPFSDLTSKIYPFSDLVTPRFIVSNDLYIFLFFSSDYEKPDEERRSRENHTQFQTKVVKTITHFQTNTAHDQKHACMSHWGGTYLTIIRQRRSEYWWIFPETKSRGIFTNIHEPEANNCFIIYKSQETVEILRGK